MPRPRRGRIVSVCAGALILARTGLLDGRRATTHWRLLDTLQSRFPEVKVEKGPIYVQDGPIWTAAGASSGFDLTLALQRLLRHQAIAVFLSHIPGMTEQLLLRGG